MNELLDSFFGCTIEVSYQCIEPYDIIDNIIITPLPFITLVDALQLVNTAPDITLVSCFGSSSGELPVLQLRVKFWVSDPGRLTEEYTRYHVVLQLRRLLAAGEMPAPPTTAVLLASYALQCE